MKWNQELRRNFHEEKTQRPRAAVGTEDHDLSIAAQQHEG